MASLNKISVCLWFDNQAEEAANFYVSVFSAKTGGEHSRIIKIARYGKAGQETHGQEPGKVMTVDFELNGQRFLALNGGPHFKFNEAVSFVINCDTQEEIDYYWEKLSEGGDPAAQRCGWLKDKYGASWQVTPSMMSELFGDGTAEASERAMKAMLQMKKIDINAMRQAAAGHV